MDELAYTLIPNLAAEVTVQAGSILSKPIFTDARLRVTVFALAAGQEMSEHTTTHEALVHILEGDIALTVAGTPHTGTAGTWLRMAPKVPHSLVAHTDAKFVLVILRQ